MFKLTEKLIKKDGVEWCADILDKFVLAEQSVGIGETVVRRYTPACPSQKSIVINIYSAESDDAQVSNNKTNEKNRANFFTINLHWSFTLLFYSLLIHFFENQLPKI